MERTQAVETIDVSLKIPADTLEKQMVLVMLSLISCLDANEDNDKPDVQVDSDKRYDFLRLQSAQRVLQAIKDRACKKATEAFLEEFMSPETDADMHSLFSYQAENM